MWVEIMINKLSALEIKHAKVPGLHGDGGGLYLQVGEGGAKSWIYRYTLNGKTREMGLGPCRSVSLAEAREKAQECRRLRDQHIDPIEHRRDARTRALLEATANITFDEASAAYIEAHRAGWRNAKHAAQWESTLKTYAEPILGRLPVQVIDTKLVLKVIEPIWATKVDTAYRVRGRIEAVLDWTKARGYRDGENPARWKGHLDKLLPLRSKVRKVAHHPALPYAELPAFMECLRNMNGVAARALEFTILTAGRTGETLGAKWDEINTPEKLWIIPAERMKAGKEHRVPLSPRALEILEEMKQVRDGNGFVFPSTRRGKPLSNMAMLKVLCRCNRDDLTVHGFRSTFRDWAADKTDFVNEVVEMAVAHAVSNKVEVAYRRGELLDKRRALMGVWERYCTTSEAGANVIPIDQGA
jgi:integrase